MRHSGLKDWARKRKEPVQIWSHRWTLKSGFRTAILCQDQPLFSVRPTLTYLTGLLYGLQQYNVSKEHWTHTERILYKCYRYNLYVVCCTVGLCKGTSCFTACFLLHPAQNMKVASKRGIFSSPRSPPPLFCLVLYATAFVKYGGKPQNDNDKSKFIYHYVYLST